MPRSTHPGVLKVAQIISRRDDISLDEAIEEVEMCKADLLQHIEEGDLLDAEDCILDQLGLEPDYLDDLVFSSF